MQPLFLSHNQLLLEVDGKLHQIYYHRNNTRLEIWMEGKVYTIESEKQGASKHPVTSPGEPLRDIMAPMPGRILKLLVEPGQEVNAHEPLLLMESMKMEVTVSAEFAAKVEKFLYREGDLVEMGAHLVILGEPND